ncbi:MAG: hypothetical protein HY835_00825 [Anaerolineae bacterium]|nr:hypothetical protein [Anaerolineae bacterium]
MKSKVLQWIAVVLIIATGYLHFITVPQEYAEAPYMGWLFLANAFGSLVSAVGIIRRKMWSGWALGIFIAGGSILGYIVSRTFGMPGMEAEAWYDPIGIPAMIVEGLFLTVIGLAQPWADSAMSREISTFGNTFKRWSASRYFYPSMMLGILVIGVFSYQLGVRNAGNHNSEHPLPETTISAQSLEEEYGIQMTLVAVTAAGGLVDVRYRVIDPEKAAKLAGEDGIMPMVYVENTDVMLMPDAHMRTQKLIADRMYFSLIPNAQNAVKRGSSVIVVFGDIALEPMITQ